MRRRAVLLALIPSASLLVGCLPATPPESGQAPPSPATTAPAAAVDASPAAPPEAAKATGLLEDLARSTDTLATLRARHGEANVVQGELPLGEGSTEPGWVLYPDVPGKLAHVYLDAEGRPTFVRVGDAGSTWTSRTGVAIGMDVAALEAINGRPFEFSGFGWDYGGNVLDFKGGALGTGGFSLTVCVPGTGGDWPPDYPLGEAPVASDDPRLASLPPYACMMGAHLPAPDAGAGTAAPVTRS